jgi:hypothetical protein
VKFFFDNCLSPNLARAIKLLDPKYDIIHLRDKFPADVSDVEWINALASEGDWVIVSGDVRITKNPQNRAAWRQSKLTAFFFDRQWTNQSLWDQAWRAVRWWPRIKSTAEGLASGRGYLVPLNYGKLKPIATD